MATFSRSYLKTPQLLDLINAADPQKSMFVSIVDNQLTLGIDPLQPAAVIDFSSEKIVPFSEAHIGQVSPSVAATRPSQRLPRRTGDYWFELRGKRTECGSLKELLAEALKVIEKTKPGTLDKLALIKARSRRIVSHDPAKLYDKQHLAGKYAEKLMNGWYYGTNNSGEQTFVWLQKAAECAGLSAEFKTSFDITDDDIL